MGKNTTKQEKAKRNREYARAHRKPTQQGRFRRSDRPSSPFQNRPPAVAEPQPQVEHPTAVATESAATEA